MPIRPKFTLGEARPVAFRQFTDREEFIETFQAAMQGNKPKELRVLMYYGVGGIGKTSLRKELVNLLEATKTDVVSAVLDFEVPSFREQETALFALRKSLREKFKIPFPTFDLAYAVYWHKIRPQIPMNQKNLPWLEEGSILSDVLHLAEHATPFGLIPKAALIAMKGSKAIKEWWLKRGNKELQDLPNLGPTEIGERLPMFWAADLKDFLEQKGFPAVLFLDSYEALWEGTRSEAKVFKQDEWVRELVSQLPEVLWVICGRERLRWEESNVDWSKYLRQHLVGGLSDEDAKRFLQSCGIRDETIQKVIVEGSKGVPYYLDLAVDTYYEIKNQHNREPVPTDFAKTPQEVLIRFLRYLDKSEIETLKVLSVPRFWNYSLFEHLVTGFKTGYPITAFSELCRFSFINQGEVADTWTMHQLMRESLEEHLEPYLLKSVHQFLFNHYNEALKDLDIKHITDQHKNVLNEAFYHGKFSLEAVEFFNWFEKASDIFNRAAQWKLLVPLYEEITSILKKALGNNHSYVAQAMNSLALLYHNQGEYSESEPLHKQALEIMEIAFGQDHPELAKLMNNLALLYTDQGKYTEAEPFYQRSLAIREKAFGQDHPEVAKTLNNLAILYYKQGKYTEAEPCFKRVLGIWEKAVGQDHPDFAISLNNLATLYRKQGKYAQAEVIYQQSLAIREKALGQDHPHVAQSLNNLANLYYDLGKYSEAEPLRLRALAIRKKILGQDHPEVATSLNDLALLYTDQGKYTEAEPLYQRALAISEKALGQDHPEVAKTLNNLACLYSAQGKYAEAEPLFNRALEIKEKVLGQSHPSVAQSLSDLATHYTNQKKYVEAEQLCQRALAIRKKALGQDHPDMVNSLRLLANIYRDQGKYIDAETLYKQAQQINEKVFGIDHHFVATVLEDMVKFYQKIGKNAEAERLEERVKLIRTKKL